MRLTSLVLLLSIVPAAAQDRSAVNGPPPPVAPASISRDASGRATLRAHRIREALNTDGTLDEPIYTQIQPIGDFIQFEPTNGAPASEATEVWILFDADNLYVSGKAYDRSPDKWVLNEMRRDVPNVSANESVGFSIDTFNDKRNGFLFEVNALGGFLDAQVTNEGFPPNQNWNAVFSVEVGRFDGGWSFEFRIPFWSLRYQPGSDQIWGFNMRRVVRWKNEESHIVPIPFSLGQRRGLMQISLHAPLVGIEAPPRGKNIEFRPFGISSVTTDRLSRPALSNDLAGNGGLDVKYGLTQNLTADLTWRTDFAQVEVDEQQVNLTRFNLLYPEKRTFFLEGQGIFNFGIGAGPNTNGGDVPTLFFSRQIGLSRGQVVPILGGGRLTGKVGKYSLGLINIQTDDKASVGALSTNFSVIRVRRDVFRRSAIGLIYADRSRSLGGGDRAQTYGADAGFSFFNDININAFAARTQTPGIDGDDLSYRGQFNYAGDRYGLVAERLVIEPGFTPEVGFVRRPNMRKWTGTARFSPRPRQTRVVRKVLTEATGSYIENNAGVLESRQWDQTFGLDFANGDNLRVQATESYEFLARPFRIDPAATIPVGGYDFNNLALRYTLGAQRRFAATASVEHGSFYGGDKTTVGVSGGRYNLTNQVQVQPGVSINRVDLPFGRFTATQLQTRVVYTLTPRAFAAALVQYNSSSHIVSTNLRLRWEYVPGSELFLVYTDERDSKTTGLPDLNNRAFVVKWAPLVRF
ncbi:MAG: DUF5916 domain-containing protein [Vicinamibacterales bacterium]